MRLTKFRLFLMTCQGQSQEQTQALRFLSCTLCYKHGCCAQRGKDAPKDAHWGVLRALEFFLCPIPKFFCPMHNWAPVVFVSPESPTSSLCSLVNCSFLSNPRGATNNSILQLLATECGDSSWPFTASVFLCHSLTA